MNMIWINNKRKNIDFHLFGSFPYNLVKALFNFADKNFLASFWTPDNMIVHKIDMMIGFLVFHKSRYYNIINNLSRKILKYPAAIHLDPLKGVSFLAANL